MPGHLNFLYFGPPEGIIPADLTGEDIEQVLVAYLKADASVTSIVGQRVYPISPPRNAVPPDLVFNMISGTTQYHLGGYTGISTARIRLTARSYDLRDCVGLRKAVFQLAGFRGMFGTVRVDFIEFEDVKDEYEQPIQGSGSDEGLYKRQWDLHIKYREAIPSN